MIRVGTVILTALCWSMIGGDEVNALGQKEMSPKAAQQYASDSEKAAEGDAEAAYRMGEALESGRLGGLKDLKKALHFYRLAAENGHQDAAARAAEIEAELSRSQKHSPPPASAGH